MGSFYVSNVTNSTLNITLNTYSLQDALSVQGMNSFPYGMYSFPYGGDGAPYLFNTGCQYYGVQNCTAACQDRGSAFGTLDTLHNCMMYPIIADQYSKNNLSSDIAQLAHSLGIQKSEWPSNLSSSVINTIGSCLDAYCTSLGRCMSGAQEWNKYSYDPDGPGYSTFLNRTGLFYFNLDPDSYINFFDLCSYHSVSVNQDIGGIGVRQIVNMELIFADCSVGICIFLDPSRHRSFGVLDGRLVEMGSILLESHCLCPVARTQ